MDILKGVIMIINHKIKWIKVKYIVVVNFTSHAKANIISILRQLQHVLFMLPGLMLKDLLMFLIVLIKLMISLIWSVLLLLLKQSITLTRHNKLRPDKNPNLHG